MANINELISKLSRYGLTELAKEVETAASVSIDDFRHFAIYDENGYGNEYVVEGSNEVTAVYGRIVEPEGGTIWQFRDNPDWEVQVPPIVRIQDAIQNTIRLAGPKNHGVSKAYWSGILAQRVPSPKAKGSIFEGMTPRKLSRAIKTAKWEEACNENVFSICTAFKTTNIPGGMYGIVMLCDLPDDADLVILDQKNTGYASLCVNGGMRVPAEETWIILGPSETGEEVVWTLHPGAPTPRATTPTDQLPVGTKLTKREALALGFNSANIR